MKQEEKNFEETKKEKEKIETKLQNILGNEEIIENEMHDLERVIIADLDAEELFNELNALDSNPEKIRNPKPTFIIFGYPTLRRYIGKVKKVELSKLQEKFADEQFNFEIHIITKARTYTLFSRYQGADIIEGNPLYKYLHITQIDNSSTTVSTYVYLGFDDDFYKTLKVRITFAQMKTYPNLETAVMNILKRHEQTESV